MKVGTDSYLDSLTAMEKLPDVLRSYIPTDIDLKRMAEEPEKYMAFMNYYVNADRKAINFDDEQKAQYKKAEKTINAIISRNLEMVG